MAEILLPVGRMIGGSLYKPQPKTDNFGKPKLDATGKQMTGFNFGVAITKEPGHTHWAQTQWGAQIRQTGATAYPGICDTPSFAWKITDGDSQTPNKKNRKPCDQEGYRDHWVLWFSQSWAPKICDATGAREIVEPDTVLPGDFVQVFCSVKSNAPSPTPGVYLNPLAVAHAGYSPLGRIETNQVDTTSVGFGAAPVAGVLAAPVGMVAAAPAAAVPPPATPTYTPTASPAPNPAFLAPPPPAPPAPPAPAFEMTRGDAQYNAHITAGWAHAQLVAAGKVSPA